MLEFTTARLLAETFYVAELERKCELVFNAARARTAIVVVDNIHLFSGAGAARTDPHGDLANLIIPHIERGLQVFATTTPEGEVALRQENERLYRKFIVFDVPAPDEDETAEILHTHRRSMTKKCRAIPESMVAKSIDLARRYLPAEYPHAAALRLLHRAAEPDTTPDEEDLRRALADELGVRPHFVGVGQAPAYAELHDELQSSVYGQDEAVREVADGLVRFSAGLCDRARPLAAFLFAGPSGCGKTSLALAAARVLSGSEESFVRFDMSEFADPRSCERLIADAPGSLTARAAARRGGVLLFDEIEKASPHVIRLLLQLLGEARLTDAAGRTVRFDSFMVVLTTNAGGGRWVFEKSEKKAVGLVLADCSEAFSPEFRARLTRTVVFRPLGADAAARIVARELQSLNDSPGLVERGLQLVWSESLPAALSAYGVSAEKGARGVQSVVPGLVASPLARWLVDHPEAQDGPVMLAPRLDASGNIASLTVDWVDRTGFFSGLPN